MPKLDHRSNFYLYGMLYYILKYHTFHRKSLITIHILNNHFTGTLIIELCNCKCMYVFLPQECSPGSFGKGCINNCAGHCLKNESCSNVDGACVGGCEDGFKGKLCNACKTCFLYVFS